MMDAFGGYSESGGMILVTMKLELRYWVRVSASPPEITVNRQEENGVVNEKAGWQEI